MNFENNRNYSNFSRILVFLIPETFSEPETSFSCISATLIGNKCDNPNKGVSPLRPCVSKILSQSLAALLFLGLLACGGAGGGGALLGGGDVTGGTVGGNSSFGAGTGDVSGGGANTNPPSGGSNYADSQSGFPDPAKSVVDGPPEKFVMDDVQGCILPTEAAALKRLRITFHAHIEHRKFPNGWTIRFIDKGENQYLDAEKSHTVGEQKGVVEASIETVAMPHLNFHIGPDGQPHPDEIKNYYINIQIFYMPRSYEPTVVNEENDCSDEKCNLEEKFHLMIYQVDVENIVTHWLSQAKPCED